MTIPKKKKDQQFYVVKANDLIRRTRYSLTTQQQKIVLYAISKIKPGDAPGTRYEIKIQDLCDACGININNTGFYYKAIKDDLQKLTTRIWVELPDKRIGTVSWISDAYITPLSGTVEIKFHELMEPYLFDLKSKYTQYQLEDVLVFRGTHAIRLYELLRSYTTQQALDEGIEREVMISLDELKRLMALEGKYKEWGNFERFVVKNAVNEINQYSDKIHITYDTYKKGRKVDKINFIITPAKAIQALTARQIKRERL